MKIMSFAIVALLLSASSAFAQDFVCSQDDQCQRDKIDAMGGMEAVSPQPVAVPQPAPIDVVALKKEIKILRQDFLKGAMEATEGGEYGGYAKGLDAMDNYLARISLIERHITPAGREELQTIRSDVTNIHSAYDQSNR